MSNVDALAADWLEAKKAEGAANKHRLNIEAQITAALEAKDEGSITHKLDQHKVTLTQPVSRTLDTDIWKAVRDRVPANLRPIKTKVMADAAGMKYLQNNEPGMWVEIAEAFTTKLGKISIKVEEVA